MLCWNWNGNCEWFECACVRAIHFESKNQWKLCSKINDSKMNCNSKLNWLWRISRIRAVIVAAVVYGVYGVYNYYRSFIVTIIFSNNLNVFCCITTDILLDTIIIQIFTENKCEIERQTQNQLYRSIVHLRDCDRF